MSAILSRPQCVKTGHYQTHLIDWYEYFMGNCSNVKATEPIADKMPDGNKPLPEPILTQFSWYQCVAWNYTSKITATSLRDQRVKNLQIRHQCHIDNFQYLQWWASNQHDYLSFTISLSIFRQSKTLKRVSEKIGFEEHFAGNYSVSYISGISSTGNFMVDVKWSSHFSYLLYGKLCTDKMISFYWIGPWISRCVSHHIIWILLIPLITYCIPVAVQANSYLFPYPVPGIRFPLVDT